MVEPLADTSTERRIEALDRLLHHFEFDEKLQQIEERRRDRSLGLIAMIVGEGNFGKSSLLNALVGKEVAEVAIVPKTFKIDVHKGSSGVGRALVRRRGESMATSLTQEDARKLSAEAEFYAGEKAKALKAGLTPPNRPELELSEIVWEHDEISLPLSMSLIDTPGLAQAIAGSTRARSLVEVLGASYEIDEIWAHWFHRADVVLWVFQANRMESEETRKAMQLTLAMYDKPIIPVATKADLLSTRGQSAAQGRFSVLFGELMEGREVFPLRLVACSPREGAPFGVEELREQIFNLAEGAEEFKRSAEARFVLDLSKSTRAILETTARTTVENLRSIATLGDRLAEEAKKIAEASMENAIRIVRNYMRSRRDGDEFDRFLTETHRQVCTESNAEKVNRIVERKLCDFVDEDVLSGMASWCFNQGANRLSDLGTRLASTVELYRPSFSASGKEDKLSVQMPFAIRHSGYGVSIRLPIFYKPPAGFFQSAWEAVRIFFGGERIKNETLREMLMGVLGADPEGLESARDLALYQIYGPALGAAVELAISEVLEAASPEARKHLEAIDNSLVTLDEISGEIGSSRGSFAIWAKYWSTIDPDVRTLCQLAREKLTSLLPSIREEVRSFRPAQRNLATSDFEAFAWSRIVRMNIPPFEPKNASRKRRAVKFERWVKNLWLVRGVAAGWLCTQANGADAMRSLIVEDGTGSSSGGFRLNHWNEAVQKEFREHVEKSTLLRQLDATLHKSVPGVEFSTGHEAFVALTTHLLGEKVKSAQESPLAFRLPVERCCGLNVLPWLGWRTIAVILLIGTVITFNLFWSRFEYLAWIVTGSAVTASLAIPFIGSFIAKRKFLANVGIESETAAQIAFQQCVAQTSQDIGAQTVDAAIERMTAKIVPRSLQKLVLKEFSFD